MGANTIQAEVKITFQSDPSHVARQRF